MLRKKRGHIRRDLKQNKRGEGREIGISARLKKKVGRKLVAREGGPGGKDTKS